MQLFEIVPKTFSWGPAFEIRRNNEAEPFATVKGRLQESKLSMVAGTGGPQMASLGHKANQTVFECADGKGDVLAILEFPWFALTKAFTMVIDGKRYNVEGPWVFGSYRCFAENGDAAFVLIEDSRSYVAVVSERVRAEIALLAVIALIQRRT